MAGGPTPANCALGPATTVTIDGTAYYSKGTASCGIEGDVTFGTVDQHPVPFAAKYGTMQPYMKVTLAEVVATLLNDLWDATTTTNLTPTTKNPSTISGAVSIAYDCGTFALQEAISTDFGEISAGDGDNVTVDATFKGIDADLSGYVADPAATGTGTFTDDV